MKEIKLKTIPPRAPDQQFIALTYGNEDRMEGLDLVNFECSKKLAAFLRGLADNIEQYKNSKEYRGSDKSIFDGLDIPE